MLCLNTCHQLSNFFWSFADRFLFGFSSSVTTNWAIFVSLAPPLLDANAHTLTLESFLLCQTLPYARVVR